MLRNRVGTILSKYDPWQLIRISLVGGVVFVAGALVFQLVMMFLLDSTTFPTSSTVNTIDPNNLSGLLNSNTMDCPEFAKVMRRGLFRAATPSRDNVIADKTVERIRSQLKLKCITELNGEPVAYVNIKGIGLRKCAAGDSVDDLFTVININEKSIEITIVGHTTVLSL